MIPNRNAADIPPEVMELLAEPTKFYLTGSRYFGTATPESDWDFFTQHDVTTAKWLEANGWHVESESYAQDPIMVAVYRKGITHVQLVGDVRVKSHLQNRLKWIFRELKPNKTQAKMLWLYATRLYNDGVEAVFHDVKFEARHLKLMAKKIEFLLQ